MSPRLKKSLWYNSEALAMTKIEWNAGLKSASEIAANLTARFGRIFTRNAVIGIANRDKEFVRKTARDHRARDAATISAAKRKKRGKGNHHTKASDIVARQAIYASKSHMDEVLVMKDQDIPVEQRKTIYELSSATCRWPIGDDAKTMTFCGARPVGGHSYCECHRAQAYVKYNCNSAPTGVRQDALRWRYWSSRTHAYI